MLKNESASRLQDGVGPTEELSREEITKRSGVAYRRLTCAIAMSRIAT